MLEGFTNANQTLPLVDLLRCFTPSLPCMFRHLRQGEEEYVELESKNRRGSGQTAYAHSGIHFWTFLGQDQL